MPPEAYSANLTDFQFRLLATICHLAGSEGRLETTNTALGTQTGNVTEKTVRRGLLALEEAGFIKRSKNKRANGYRGKDVLDITSPGGPEEAQEIGASNVHTSRGYKLRSHIVNKPLVPNSQDSNQLKDIRNVTVSMKEIKVPMRRYEDDSDNLAGFGLVEERDAPQIGDEAPFLYKRYLASFGKKMNQARENLGLTKVNAPVDTSVKTGTLTASDGRVFQNSLSGRAQLERYEKRIGATQ